MAPFLGLRPVRLLMPTTVDGALRWCCNRPSSFHEVEGRERERVHWSAC